MIHPAIPTRCIIPMGQDWLPFAAHRCQIDARDEGSGPYLAVRFFNDEPLDGESEHEGYFSSREEIDRFCQELRLCWKCVQYGNSTANPEVE